MKLFTLLKPVVLFSLLFTGAMGVSSSKNDLAAGEVARQMTYLSISGENRIALWAADPQTGLLTEVGSVGTGGSVGALALHPNGNRLYAAVRSTGAVASFDLNPSTGGLTKISETPVINNPVYIAVDGSGRYLLTAYYGQAKAAVYRLNDNGEVVAGPVSTVESTRHPHSILSDLSNHSVYIPNTGADLIQQFSFDTENGALTPLDPPEIKTETKSGARHFTFHPSNKFVYFCNEHNSHVSVFAREENSGKLTQLQTISTLPEGGHEGNTNADIHITPDGKYVYASNRGHDSIAAFAVDQSTGKLTSLGQFETESIPREFGLDPAGKYLYSAGQKSGKLAAYKIDPATGKLDRIATYPVGKSPAWVLVIDLK